MWFLLREQALTGAGLIVGDPGPAPNYCDFLDDTEGHRAAEASYRAALCSLSVRGVDGLNIHLTEIGAV